jgi:uncharacterized membrane protein
MKQDIVIRGKWDRMRFTFMFEVLLILLIAPVIAWALDKSVLDTGLLSILLATKAMILNYAYNYGFDLMDVSYGRIPTQRSFKWRVIHALGFEVVLTITSLPIIIWWLGLSIYSALLMDLTVVSFVILYTIVFTRIYDEVFPVIQFRAQEQ